MKLLNAGRIFSNFLGMHDRLKILSFLNDRRTEHIKIYWGAL